MRTIRSRLYLAFGVAACMTVVGSAFALYASSNFSTTMTEIVARSMPATVESLRLSEQASTLVAAAPSLMAVEDEDRRAVIVKQIDAQTQRLYTTIERVRGLDPAQSTEIDAALAPLNDRLTALNKIVAERITLSVQRRALAATVHKVHEALLEAITPAIDDANFDLMTRDKASGGDATLDRSIDSLRHLLQMQAGVNLLAGLLIESSMVTDKTDLPPLRDSISAATRNIGTDLQTLSDSEQRRKIGALYGRLASIAGDHGIVVLRENELNREHDAQAVFAAALSDAAKLKRAVDSLIQLESGSAQTLSAQAIWQLRLGRALLVVLSAAALLAAGLIAWLYVGRNIIGRLTLLSGAMRQIAAGEQNVPIAVGGQDEIADMAQALVVFRQAIDDVSGARQREARRAEESELRSRQLQAATQDFQAAVNDILHGLDEASKSMDDYARVMAQTADDNQVQAVAAANASTEAAANASNVAASAEEIAHSVEEISHQAHTSAEIARQATEEATTITEAMEQLTTSVDRINSMSNLIRDIAAQTNLLALNATIEAARAGAAGRGFAIVAQEVKGLAAQTEKATGDITQQISAIERTTSQAVGAIQAIATTIGKLDENAVTIAGAVQQQDSVTKEIARTANAAADCIRAVSASVATVSEAAGKTGQVANAVLNAGDALATRANKLRNEVERFLAQVRVA